MNKQNTVIVQFDKDGEINYFCSGDDVRLFIVDERAKNDRVYEWLTRDSEIEIKEVLKSDPIGSSKDGRHEAIKHRIMKRIEGKKHLEPVK